MMNNCRKPVTRRNSDASSTLPDYKVNALMTEVSVNRMTQVVNDLLLLATTEEIERNDELINIQIMFESIFDELHSLYEGRGITKDMAEQVVFPVQ